MLWKRWFKIILVLIALLIIVYAFGPHPATPVYSRELPQVPVTSAGLEGFIKKQEAAHILKPNNEARIIWADTSKQKTEYAIVYLHGFSASQEEGAPIHTNIAKEFGCNLYLSRLAEHGIDTTEPLLHLTPENYWESVKEALVIGKQLGKKIILMGTSTGCTNALQLAASYPDDIAALVLMSPNIALFNDKAWILNKPWGLQVARLVNGGDHIVSEDNRPIYKQYWYWRYPLEATTQLQEYLQTTMTEETFSKVKQPTLMLYYYKDNIHQDSVVSIPAMLKMYDELGTPKDKKIKQSIPNAGNHVIGSYLRSKDLLGVQQAIEAFMQKTMHINALPEQKIITINKQ
ncbi:MAG: alpha/beta hydrolase [Agriterribacter sp.]